VNLPKQRFNIYTTLLLLSFVAITTGFIMLLMEIGAHSADKDGKSFAEWPPWNTDGADVTIPPALNNR
jgi:hypothetical protein